MAADPIFASTPKTALATLATANTARDGTGTVVTVLSAGASGSKINEVWVAATGTTTAGVVRIFLHDGSNYFLIHEELVTALTPSASVAVWMKKFVWSNFVVPTGYSLRMTTHNSETFKVAAFYGDF